MRVHREAGKRVRNVGTIVGTAPITASKMALFQWNTVK
jgi:hypothetical protein